MSLAKTSMNPRALPPAPLVLVEEITLRVLNEYTEAIATIVFAAARIANADARASLNEAAAMLRGYARAHEALRAPESGATIDLGAYLERLCSTLCSARLRDRGVKLTLSQERIMLPSERCWRVGLIVAELITNALRHGFHSRGGMILIEVARAGDHVLCRVADNGADASGRFPSRASWVLERLSAELGGHLQWLSGPHGVCVRLLFPTFEPGTESGRLS